MATHFVPGVGDVDLEVSAHTYAYNEDGTMATDTATVRTAAVGTATIVKTYTYTSGRLISVSGWVKQ